MRGVSRLCALTVLLWPGAIAAQAQTPTSAGVFTAEQASRGEALYRSSCSRCHGANLERTDPEASNLTGAAFDQIFVGKTLQERYERIFYTMPPNNPSSLPPAAYLDILAYILSYNGVPAGDEELPLDPAVLASITIEKP